MLGFFPAWAAAADPGSTAVVASARRLVRVVLSEQQPVTSAG